MDSVIFLSPTELDATSFSSAEYGQTQKFKRWAMYVEWVWTEVTTELCTKAKLYFCEEKCFNFMVLVITLVLGLGLK